MGAPAKVAIVTGAPKGIGAATAAMLAAQGYQVCVHYATRKAEAEQVVKAITAKGGKAIAVQADLGGEAGVMGLFEAVDKQLGPVSALVNNAALQASGPVESMARETLERVFAVNVIAIFLCCREALKRMRSAGGGAIVNVSSEAARFGGSQMTAYAASKAAVSTFTVGFAREAAACGVRVNAVSPGVIDTEAHASAAPERRKTLVSSIPLGRMGTAGEVAETIAWLLSDKASYVSGAMLSITGGR